MILTGPFQLGIFYDCESAGLWVQRGGKTEPYRKQRVFWPQRSGVVATAINKAKL